MKKVKLSLLLSGLVICTAAAFTAAADIPLYGGNDENKLTTAADSLNNTAARPAGEQRVVEHIKTMFKVNDDLVQNLRAKGLGYGEITIVLALANKLPGGDIEFPDRGGITDANIQKVLALRQGPPVLGWGQVAKQLGLKLGPVVSAAQKLKKAAAAPKQGKVAAPKSAMPGPAAKPDRPEKIDRPEKPEKMEKPEKPETPKHH